jgi:hypothetical protein
MRTENLRYITEWNKTGWDIEFLLCLIPPTQPSINQLTPAAQVISQAACITPENLNLQMWIWNDRCHQITTFCILYPSRRWCNRRRHEGSSEPHPATTRHARCRQTFPRATATAATAFAMETRRIPISQPFRPQPITNVPAWRICWAERQKRRLMYQRE